MGYLLVLSATFVVVLTVVLVLAAPLGPPGTVLSITLALVAAWFAADRYDGGVPCS